MIRQEREMTLPRRYTEQNENDLLMENLYESHKDTDLHMQPKNFDHDNCQNIAKHLVHFSALPVECRKYADVVAYTKSHDSDTSHPTQWLG
mmetsp:Transcript_10051/g.27544  ORF Transcript_10051/g.27544 Transcript_10051/m.27544 type:complete len:91 (+) Transcript_10051:3-275(+)